MMTKRPCARSWAALLLLTAVCAWFVGCEDEPSLSDVDQYFADHPYISDPRADPTSPGLDIEPQNATVSTIGEEILFTVDGGASPFSWAVATPANGTVGVLGNDRQAIYTSLSLKANNVIVSDRDGRAAIADINGTTVALSITPTSVTIGTGVGESANFFATGGVPPYDWKTVIPSLGAMVVIDSNTARYSSLGGAGTNTVVLVDQAGTLTKATVKQK